MRSSGAKRSASFNQAYSTELLVSDHVAEPGGHEEVRPPRLNVTVAWNWPVASDPNGI